VIGTEEQDAFIRELGFAVVTSLRKDGSLSNSVVFIVVEGDDLNFSTTENRLKTRTIENDPRVVPTIAGDYPPYCFLTVGSSGSIQRANITDTTSRSIA
jgi:hypothetical protein